MEYLIGNYCDLTSPAGEINIKVPLQSHIVKTSYKSDTQMCINTALTLLQLDNVW